MPKEFLHLRRVLSECSLAFNIIDHGHLWNRISDSRKDACFCSLKNKRIQKLNFCAVKKIVLFAIVVNFWRELIWTELVTFRKEWEVQASSLEHAWIADQECNSCDFLCRRRKGLRKRETVFSRCFCSFSINICRIWYIKRYMQVIPSAVTAF